jgi:phosphohistidine phosphatase
MDVYLLRHAVAAEQDKVKFPDDDRPLTDDGVAKMRESAAGIAELIDRPSLILTSPLIRARQTAEIAAKALGCRDRVLTCDLLKPGAKVDEVRKELAARAGEGAESVMLVGHEPDMGEIASALIGATGSVVEFKKGSLCAIHLNDERLDDPGLLLWHLTSKQLRAIGA